MLTRGSVACVNQGPGKLLFGADIVIMILSVPPKTCSAGEHDPVLLPFYGPAKQGNPNTDVRASKKPVKAL